MNCNTKGRLKIILRIHDIVDFNFQLRYNKERVKKAIQQEGDKNMWTRIDLKMRAKQAFQRNYWQAVVVALVMMIITSVFTWTNTHNLRDRYGYYGDGLFGGYSLILAAFAGFIAILGVGIIILNIFAGNVLMVGGHRFFIQNQTGPVTASELIYGFKSGNYGNIVLVMFLRDLYTFLWTLLFIIPGIIKYYEYLMVPYILAENPGMPREEAFLISKKMMMGQKLDAFVLSLSFIGWRILEALTLGIVGIFYVEPYSQATFAELYAFNRELAYRNGYIR